MLTVEDGTGLANADSYLSLAEADAYFASYVSEAANEAWASTSDDEREVALRVATRDLDLLYGSRYLGSPVTTTQALLFPRIAPGPLPSRLKHATAELAALAISGYSPSLQNAERTDFTEKTFRVEGVYSETVKFASAGQSTPLLNRVNLLLYGLVAEPLADGDLVYLNVVRG